MLFDKTFVHVPLESLNFDLLSETTDSGRFYVTPSGDKYKSVTTVLSELNKSAILEWRQRVGEEEANRVSRIAASKGTKYHSTVEKYLQNDLTPMQISGLIPEVKQMFLRMKPILDENIGEIYGIEKALYSDDLRLAGRVDLIANYDGVLSIVDHKTASKKKQEGWITNYFYQAAIYAKMLEERTGNFPERIVIAIAVVDDEPQVFVKNTKDYLMQAQEFVYTYHMERKTV